MVTRPNPWLDTPIVNLDDRGALRPLTEKLLDQAFNDAMRTNNIDGLLYFCMRCDGDLRDCTCGTADALREKLGVE